MSEKDLIPLNMLPPEQAREIQRLGGSQSTPKKRLAAQIRELKKQGLSDTKAERLWNIMESPELSALDIQLYLGYLWASCKAPADMARVVDLFIKWHKMHHGEKRQVELNVNVQGELQSLKDFLQGRVIDATFEAQEKPEPEKIGEEEK